MKSLAPGCVCTRSDPVVLKGPRTHGPPAGPVTLLDGPDELPEVRLKDLRAGLPPVHILGRVVTVSRKEITSRSDGRRRPILTGLLSDGTATVRFTWWDPPSEGVERGTVLRAVNAQVREFRQRAELSFGWSTRVQPAGDLELPAVSSAELPLKGVADLEPRSEGFRLEVRVTDVTARTVTVGEERRAVHSGHFEDGSGSVPFTAWVDFRLRPGDTVRVAGGYVRLFRGAVELALDERSHVEPIAAQLVRPAPTAGTTMVPLGALEARQAAGEVRTEGLVVALGTPSGLVHRCPTCRRVLQEGTCRLHGAVSGVPDLRARVVIDDGTGVGTANLSREITERLIGRSLDDILAEFRRTPDPARIESEIRARVIGHRLRVRARARVDDFGLALFPTECEVVPPDPGRAVETLAQMLREVPR